MKNLAAIVLVLLVAGNMNITKAQTHVTFYTNVGKFVVEMYDSIAPITSGNFIKLVNEKYFDGVTFHRVMNDYMIQGGDPTGTSRGGPGYTIKDEFAPAASNVQKSIFSRIHAGILSPVLALLHEEP